MPTRQVIIALTGLTGAGKTTFASLVTERRDLEIGHGVNSCTQRPQEAHFWLDGTRITLIDTPGFDDTLRTDVDILEIISDYLATAYGQNKLLDGLILLHPVTGNRVTGSEGSRTQLIKEILGQDAYKRVVIATTMWDNIIDRTLALKQEEQRKQPDGIWHSMCQQGATVLQHDNTKESAHRILRHLLQITSTPFALQLQRELVQHNGVVAQTSVGQEMDRQHEAQIARLEEKIATLERSPSFRARSSSIRIHELRSEIKQLKSKRAKLRKLAAEIILVLGTHCEIPSINALSQTCRGLHAILNDVLYARAADESRECYLRPEHDVLLWAVHAGYEETAIKYLRAGGLIQPLRKPYRELGPQSIAALKSRGLYQRRLRYYIDCVVEHSWEEACCRFCEWGCPECQRGRRDYWIPHKRRSAGYHTSCLWRMARMKTKDHLRWLDIVLQNATPEAFERGFVILRTALSRQVEWFVGDNLSLEPAVVLLRHILNMPSVFKGREGENVLAGLRRINFFHLWCRLSAQERRTYFLTMVQLGRQFPGPGSDIEALEELVKERAGGSVALARLDFYLESRLAHGSLEWLMERYAAPWQRQASRATDKFGVVTSLSQLQDAGSSPSQNQLPLGTIKMASATTLTARCHCKSIHFTVTVPTSSLPLRTHLCHCHICRLTHGSFTCFHSTLPDFIQPVFIAPSSISLLTPYTHPAALSTRLFCSTCGCHIGDYDHPPPSPTPAWRVATSLITPNGGSIFTISSHFFPFALPGPNFANWLRTTNNTPLRVFNPEPSSETFPLPRPPPPATETDEAGHDILRAECHCSGVSFTMPRPNHPSIPRDPLIEKYISPTDPRKWKACLDACDDCRLVTGAHVIGWMFVPVAGIRPPLPGDLEGYGTLKVYKSSQGVRRGFCGVCGATVFFLYEGEERGGKIVDVAVGVLRAADAVADEWVTWWTGRVAFEKDGRRFDEAESHANPPNPPNPPPYTPFNPEATQNSLDLERQCLNVRARFKPHMEYTRKMEGLEQELAEALNVIDEEERVLFNTFYEMSERVGMKTENIRDMRIRTTGHRCPGFIARMLERRKLKKEIRNLAPDDWVKNTRRDMEARRNLVRKDYEKKRAVLRDTYFVKKGTR
ncbi:hypothetical protein OQA88_10742 [Cercophora sp. LCS_1]